MAIVIIMAKVVPNPTYPAITTPTGTSSIDQSILILNNQTFGVVPDDEETRLFFKNALDSKTVNANSIMYFPDETAMLDEIEDGTLIQYGVIFVQPPIKDNQVKTNQKFIWNDCPNLFHYS